MAGTPIYAGLSGCYASPQKYYDKARRNEGARPEFLDHKMETNPELVNFIRNVYYNDDMRSILEGRYSNLVFNNKLYGKQMKTEVEIFPTAFMDFEKEPEFDMLLYFNNKCCGEIYNNLTLDGEIFDASRMGNEVVKYLTFLKASNETLEHMESLQKEYGRDYYRMFTPGFGDWQRSLNSRWYSELLGDVKGKYIKGYDEEVVKKYLDKLDGWIEPEKRFNSKLFIEPL